MVHLSKELNQLLSKPIELFCIVFCAHFYPDTDHAEKLVSIQKDFQTKFKVCWDNLISTVTQEKTVEC